MKFHTKWEIAQVRVMPLKMAQDLATVKVLAAKSKI
jgi:hypothetical protein